MRRLPDLDSLQLLMAIGTTGSLTEAGRQRGLGQPAVSARLRGMERQVGMRLVERTSKGSRLTGGGVLVADWGRETMASASSLDAGLPRSPTGAATASPSRRAGPWRSTWCRVGSPAWLVGIRERPCGSSR